MTTDADRAAYVDLVAQRTSIDSPKGSLKALPEGLEAVGVIAPPRRFPR